MRFKILKPLLIIFLLIILFLIAVSILIRIDTVQQRLAGFVEDSISKNLGQEFDIGRVDFNVIRGVIIHNIQLDIQGNDFIKVETLEIGYPLELSNIVKQLAQRQISVNTLRIKGLYLRLSKQSNGSWNYSALQKNKDKDKDEKSARDKSAGPGWRIKILDAGIYESEIVLITDISKPERKINISRLETSFDINTTGNAEIDIDNGDISIEPDNLSFEEITADMKFSKDEIKIKEVRFKLNGSPVSLTAEMDGKDYKKFKVQSDIRGFKFEKGLINLELNGSGEFMDHENIYGQFSVIVENSEYLGNKYSFKSSDIKIKESSLVINNATLEGDLGKAVFNASTDIKKLLDKNMNNEFNLSLSAEDIKYSELINFSKLTDPVDKTKNEISVNAEIYAQGYFNNKNDFKIETDLQKLSLTGAAGDAGFSGQTAVSNEAIKVKLNGQLKDLNLQYFTENQNYRSSINSIIILDTELPLDLDLKKARGNIDIDILRSTFSGKKIQSGEVYSEFMDENIKNARLNLNSDFLNVGVTGATINNQLDFKYRVESDELKFVTDINPNLNLSGKLLAQGTIIGDISTPAVNYSVNANQAKFNSIEAREIESRGTIKFNDMIAMDSDGEISDLSISGNEFSKVDYKVRTEGRDLLCSLNAVKNQNSNIVADFTLSSFKEKKNIEFNKLLINLNNLTYENKTPFNINFLDGVKIDGFNLYEGSSSIYLNLTKKTNEIDSEISIHRLNIENIFKLVGSEESPAGILSGSINTSGSPQNIKFQTDLEIDDFKYKKFESDVFLIKSSYKRPNLSLDIKSKQEGKDTLLLTGVVQTDLNLNEISASFAESEMNLTLKSGNLNLSPVSRFVGVINEIHGYLVSNLEIKGKINSPLLYGNMSLSNIEVKLESLNNKLILEKGNIVFDGSNARLKEILVASGDGKGVINGNLDIRDLNYDLKAELDQLTLKPKTIRTNVSGDLSLSGKEKSINITGILKLNKTRISLKEDRSRKASDIKFVNGGQDDSEEIVIKDKKEDDYFRDNVSLDLSVKIAKNSWVRGKGANVELKGDIDIDKNYEEEMVLTGNILTVRGTYKIFGKLFKIQKGNVNFPAIKKINPLLNITALYNVSDVNVFVNIGGDVESPKINLRSDPTMQETDIISYLLFGAPADKLGTGERSSLNQVAAGIAGGAVLNEFKGVLGEEFSPDVLSFGTSAAGPELEVGKYLNDDLYVAYKRKTSTDASTPIPTDNVKVEYRLFDYLSVASEVGSEQAGADLFFNYEF